jgi:hypothetical protein
LVNKMDGITTGLAFLSGLGLPQILLWVLTFAVVFEIIKKLNILSRAPAAIVAMVVGFLVLLAVPAAVIAAIATMSTGLIVAAIGFLVVLSILAVGNIHSIEKLKDKDGNETGIQAVHPFGKHGTKMTILAIVVAALIFIAAGGPALIGISVLPTISLGTWFLIVVGLAVLWMLSEAGK